METVQTANAPSFESVWALVQGLGKKQEETERIMRESAECCAEIRKETERIKRETAESCAEIRKETERIKRESTESCAEIRKETERIKRETAEQMKETDRQIDKLSKNVGGLGNSIGNVIETLFAAHLWEQFPEYKLRMSCRDINLFDENGNQITEIDILLVNTEWAMVVEVKSKAKEDDVNKHIVRMERILKYPPGLIPPKAKLLGAIAGGVVMPEAAAYAHQCGFFVLELAGESVVRVPAPPDFKPREWQQTINNEQ